MEIKEVIQSKINLLNKLNNCYIITIPQSSNKLLNLGKLLNNLQKKLQRAKSIEDIERKAFEAGRNYTGYTDLPFTSKKNIIWKYETFEDYLKSKENGIRE